MQTYFTPAPPNPTILLALGDEEIHIAAEIADIYLRSDKRRQSISHFLALVNSSDNQTDSDNSKGKLHLISIDEVICRENEGQELTFADYNQFISAREGLQEVIEAILHELLTHEAYIRAQIDGLVFPPLNLIVLADLWDTTSASAIIPLACLLQGMTRGLPQLTSHFMLSVARFPDEVKTPREEAAFYSMLQSLDILIDPNRAEEAKPLMDALQLEHRDALTSRFYFFDLHKPGGWVVKDRVELSTIIGNFALAILNREVSQELNDTIQNDYAQPGRPYYCTAGAAALVYDPIPVVNACAARLGCNFIRAEFWNLPTVGSDHVQDKLDEIINMIGPLRTWLESILVTTPCSIKMDKNCIAATIKVDDLKLEMLPLDQFRQLNWVEKINNHLNEYEKVQLPKILSKMRVNAKELENKLLELQASFLKGLLVDAQLAPGGLMTSKKVLDLWQDNLDGILHTLNAFKSQSQPTNEELKSNLQSGLDELDKATNEFPEFSLLLRWLPSFLRQRIAELVLVLQKRKPYIRIMQGRNQCLEDIEALMREPIQDLGWEMLQEQAKALIQPLKDMHHALNDLETLLHDVENLLDEKGKAFPPIGANQPGHPIFRSFPAGERFMQYAYERFKANREDMRQTLLVEARMLEHWQKKGAAQIANEILAFGCEKFDGLWGISVGDVLRIESEDREQMVRRVINLSQASLPLLSPNFNRSETDMEGGLSQKILVLSRDQINDDFPSLLNRELSGWNAIFTGDPYVTILYQAWSMVGVTFFL